METSDLISRIYEGVGNPEAMTDTIKSIVRVSRSRGAQFGVLDRTGSWLQASVVGIDPAALELYVKDYAAEDPRLPYYNRHPGQWIFCQEAVGDVAAYERSALVNEVLDKNEARFACIAGFHAGPSHSVSLTLMRSRRDGQYGEEEARRLAPLLPHLRRAMSLHVRIGRLESTLASFDALVDRLSAPVLLVDGSGVLHYANSAGQEALRQARFLTLRNGRVWPRSARQERQFAETLAAAAVEPSASMLIHDGENRTAALIIQSLRGQADLICMPRADRVIFLVRAEERPPVDSVRLQVLYGLTPAETRLAEHLALGENLEEIGERFRLSRETLKSQLRSLFAKTRTGRQSELVALLLSSVSVPIA